MPCEMPIRLLRLTLPHTRNKHTHINLFVWFILPPNFGGEQKWENFSTYGKNCLIQWSNNFCFRQIYRSKWKWIKGSIVIDLNFRFPVLTPNFYQPLKKKKKITIFHFKNQVSNYFEVFKINQSVRKSWAI